MITIRTFWLHSASQFAMNTMHFLTSIRFALVLPKIHFTLDDILNFCGKCIVMHQFRSSRTWTTNASLGFWGNDCCLLGQLTPTVTPRATTLAETSGSNLDSWFRVSLTSVSEDQPTPPPGRSRRERRQLRSRDRVFPHDPQGDQFSASKRPRPRLQLTGSMYKNIPFLNFCDRAGRFRESSS